MTVSLLLDAYAIVLRGARVRLEDCHFRRYVQRAGQRAHNHTRTNTQWGV